jgi:hypothetical protein
MSMAAFMKKRKSGHVIFRKRAAPHIHQIVYCIEFLSSNSQMYAHSRLDYNTGSLLVFLIYLHKAYFFVSHFLKFFVIIK